MKSDGSFVAAGFGRLLWKVGGGATIKLVKLLANGQAPRGGVDSVVVVSRDAPRRACCAATACCRAKLPSNAEMKR